MAPATNTPRDYLELKKQRQIVFYPAGDTNFTLYEDDGISAKYQKGEYAQTRITSQLADNNLTIKLERTQGGYEGFDPEKVTELDIRTKKAPVAIEVKVGNDEVQLTEVSSIEEFEKQANCFYFDQHYLTNPYLKEFDPKLEQSFLRIKIGQVDVVQTNLTVNITGIDDTPVAVNKIPTANDTVAIPVELKQDETQTTDTAISVLWEPVLRSESYQLKIDHLLYTNIKKPQFTLNSLKPDTLHEFQVRVVTEKGVSAWSPKVNFKTKIQVEKEK
ncbi:DUF5110 domain-containing protein [Lactobacillus apis]|uniref:DUF5110 domain-containing protein n=1 Tax=Lactobacillus apis TaxID=303541 RepID=UPI003B82C9F1